MSKKDVINAIEVKSPCSESWDEMTGNDQIRFCSHCAKSVNNISEMKRKEALRLIRRSEGRICIRYIKDPKTSRPLYSENLYKIARRASGLAAGVMTASISLSTAAYAQGDMKEDPNAKRARTEASRDGTEKNVAAVGSGGIGGFVTDPNGAVIPAVPISLINEKSGETINAASDEQGRYEIKGVAAGKYRLRFEGTSGFQTKELSDVGISDDKDIQKNVILDVGLIAAGGMISVELPPFENALSTAVQDDDLETVKNLIMRHADVNAREKGRKNITPLFLAVENGNVEIAELLLRFGARVNARNLSRQTPLMMLDDDASAELVDLLVKYGARPNLIDNKGNTALILATESNPDVSIVKALLNAGADVDHQNQDGDTALIKAAGNDNLEAVRALIQAGADLNLENSEGETAWDLASDAEVTDLIESYGGQSGDPTEDPDAEGTEDPASDDDVN